MKVYLVLNREDDEEKVIDAVRMRHKFNNIEVVGNSLDAEPAGTGDYQLEKMAEIIRKIANADIVVFTRTWNGNRISQAMNYVARLGGVKLEYT